MSYDLDESKQWCCPNCGTPWEVFKGKQYPFCGCSVVSGPGTIRFDPVECSKLKSKEPDKVSTLRPHPAVYSDALLPVMAEMLQGCTRVLDPFAGTGKIFQLSKWLPDTHFDAVEIEPEWAAYDSRITIGNALYLPWKNKVFDGVCTSCTYGNRMADHHEAKDASKRVSYKHYLGRNLSTGNTGAMQWGHYYQSAHRGAWSEAKRVLVPGGKFVLNIKDHIRKGKAVPVTQWHIDVLRSFGFELIDHVKVDCPGMGFGHNREARVPFESVILFVLR